MLFRSGPFSGKDGSDFWQFVEQHGVRLQGDYKKIPITYDSVFNFKIRSTGEFAGATREITAIVMDLNKTAAKVKDFVSKDKQAAGGGSGAGGAAGTGGAGTGAGGTGAAGGANDKNKGPTKGPPRVVYWNER